MSRRRVIALALVASVAASLGAIGNESAKAQRQRVYPAEFPDSSAGRAIAENWCLMCHSATLVTQQAKDSVGWEKTLTQMEKWGVKLTLEERDSLLTYLRAKFPARH